MNAGAYGGEMKDVLYKCEHIDKNGDRGFLENDDLKLSYRHSAYYIRVVSATLSPLEAELFSAEEKPITVPPRLSIADSKLKRVLVLGS